jgi:hypothetical protein
MTIHRRLLIKRANENNKYCVYLFMSYFSIKLSLLSYNSKKLHRNDGYKSELLLFAQRSCSRWTPDATLFTVRLFSRASMKTCKRCVMYFLKKALLFVCAFYIFAYSYNKTITDWCAVNMLWYSPKEFHNDFGYRLCQYVISGEYRIILNGSLVNYCIIYMYCYESKYVWLPKMYIA